MKKFLIAVVLVLLPTLAFAQSQRNPCYINSNGGCIPVSTANPMPITSGGTQTVTGTVAATQSGAWTVQNTPSSFTNITTNTSYLVKSSSGVFAGIIVNTAGTTSSVAVYDNVSCGTTKIGTFSTTTQASILVNVNVVSGICVIATGGTPADITILWR